MKKIRLFLFAAILGIAASGFNVKFSGEAYVLQGGNYIPKATADGACTNGGTVCTYTLLPIEERMHEEAPFSAEDFSFNTAEGKTWTPN